MKYFSEYSWINSYLDNNMLWLEDSLVWDEVFDLTCSDFNIFSSFTAASFFNLYLYCDSKTQISVVDWFLLSYHYPNPLRESYEFWLGYSFDNTIRLFNKFYFLEFLYYADYQDFMLVILQHSPELSLALLDFVQVWWLDSASSFKPSSVFDIFSDNLTTSVSEFVEYFINLTVYTWVAIMFLAPLRISQWVNLNGSYLARIVYSISSSSRVVKFQIEAGFLTFFLLFFYLSMSLATFDDDQEELIEGLNLLIFYLFLSLLVYFIYKSSTHYLPFLEPSVKEGRTLGFALKQFSKDITNNIAFVLRFLVLALRLNIYDTVDDIFDSYYIFVMDLDDDEYFFESFFSNLTTVTFWVEDNNDDRSFLYEDETDFFVDFFALYFIIWGKLTLFIFFILEEIARVALALYITYLIIFEIHAVSRSYSEDTYFNLKRSSSKNTLTNNLNTCI